MGEEVPQGNRSSTDSIAPETHPLDMAFTRGTTHTLDKTNAGADITTGNVEDVISALSLAARTSFEAELRRFSEYRKSKPSIGSMDNTTSPSANRLDQSK